MRVERARLIRSNIMRNPHVASNRIPTTIPLLLSTIAHENTKCIALMGCKNIAQTTKKTKI
jgi:hypothetical protein